MTGPLERAAAAAREEIVRQYRDDERGKCPAGVNFYEEHISPVLVARAVIEAIWSFLESDEVVERAAAALRDVPSIWHRYNDWTSDRTQGKPFELCRYGDGDSIIVLAAFASEEEAEAAIVDMINTARARAVLQAAICSALTPKSA